IVFSVESSLAQEEAARAALANNRLNLVSDELAPFWAASEALCDAPQPYDAVMLPDSTLRAATVSAEALARYSALVLPDCAILTAHQAEAPSTASATPTARTPTGCRSWRSSGSPSGSRAAGSPVCRRCRTALASTSARPNLCTRCVCATSRSTPSSSSATGDLDPRGGTE